jgi:hypothetical protein
MIGAIVSPSFFKVTLGLIMKNKVNTVLLLIVSFLIIILFNQNKLQRDSEKRLRGAILSEWKERKEIEDSVNNEMQSKRNNQEFVTKLGYQRELEEMVDSKLALLEEGISTFKSDLESLVNSRLSEYAEEALSFNQQLEARIKKMQEYVDLQDARRKESESSFKERLKLSEDNQEKYAAQVKYLKQEIQILLKKQVDLEKRINKYDAGELSQ